MLRMAYRKSPKSISNFVEEVQAGGRLFFSTDERYGADSLRTSIVREVDETVISK